MPRKVLSLLNFIFYAARRVPTQVIARFGIWIFQNLMWYAASVCRVAISIRKFWVMKTIVAPSCDVVLYVFSNKFQIAFATNQMVMVAGLPSEVRFFLSCHPCDIGLQRAYIS